MGEVCLYNPDLSFNFFPSTLKSSLLDLVISIRNKIIKEICTNLGKISLSILGCDSSNKDAM